MISQASAPREPGSSYLTLLYKSPVLRLSKAMPPQLNWATEPSDEVWRLWSQTVGVQILLLPLAFGEPWIEEPPSFLGYLCVK